MKNIRGVDKDLQKLKNYAKSLGLKVKFVKHKRDNPAAWWCPDTKAITVSHRPYRPKVDVVLILLHELGHQLDYVYHKPTKLEDEAHSQDWLRKSNKDKPIAKKYRKAIYESECRGIAFMDTIAKELNLSIPMWRVYCDQEWDRWNYKYYYIHGKYATKREMLAKAKELRKYYRSKHEDKLSKSKR